MCTTALVALAVANPTAAQDKKGKAVNTLKVGDKAPKFASIDDEGKPFKSTDVVGKKAVVLFFYPAALTGG
jgi:peroxiredoxin Q/BCP